MADPKKPPEDQAVKPEEMSYPTPPLDPKTGAPLDTRFQGDTRSEVAQPQPKSGGEPPKAEAKKEEIDEDDDDDDEKPPRTKSAQKPQRRR